ncbi:hypothetical protein RUND412_002872 [Rhizina undulata]
MQVTFKPETPDSEVRKAKDEIIAAGGEILHEYSLIKGFSAKFPADYVTTLDSSPHVENVEKDQEVSINN